MCAAVLLAVFIVKSFSQTEPLSITEPYSIADMDREAEKIAVSIREFIRSGTTRTGSIRNEETVASDLARYWTETIFAFLSAAGADNRGVTIFQNPSISSGYVLRCTMLEIGPVLRIYTKMLRGSDLSVAVTWISDMTKTPYLGSLLAGSSGQWDGFEPDGREEPVPLEIDGEELSRTLHENDEDWFVISPEEDGYVVVRTSGETDTFMELYTDSFEKIAANDDGPDDYNAGIGFMAEGGSGYIVLVRAYSGDETGAYGITASFSDIPDKDMEPNNSMDSAFLISLDTPLKACIPIADDEDWYKIVLSGGYFTVSTEGGIDTYMELFDGDGEKIAENDDSSYDANALISLLVEPGTYYINVAAYETGEYTLYCQIQEPNQVDAYEPDNGREDAKTISFGEEQTRTFTTEDDVDWVQFTVDAGDSGRVSCSIRAWGVEYDKLDTYLGLYDARGNLIAEDDDSGGNYSPLISRRLTPGIYYIRVHTLEYPSGSYKLSVTRD
jgi:hypothetical protein